MLTRILTLVVTVLFLAACSTSPKTDGTSGAQAEDQGTVNVYGDVYPKNPEPGTQGDLAVNIGDRAFFDYNSSVLNAEGKATLERQANWLKQYSNVNVTVEGHCDERGTREYNLALGERRAAAARNYLVGLGVAQSRISTISYGKERPAVLGSDEESFRLNRRAVTVVNQ